MRAERLKQEGTIVSGSYSAITEGIEVSVEPFYMDDESSPENSEFIWAYMVEIHNGGNEPVQLKTRYWQIRDGLGRLEEVRGDGVVGEQPVIEPGETYEYSSHCRLTTDSGIMAGSYSMERPEGSQFEVAIPAFSLDLPDAVHSLN
ncbi:Co2+/Mg2+ efflux protein ApaG [Rhodobacterales bacterium]|nr:Co2+/Mg2+ efflux protein ApaG [Rhodobacterales bacterium]